MKLHDLLSPVPSFFPKQVLWAKSNPLGAYKMAVTDDFPPPYCMFMQSQRICRDLKEGPRAPQLPSYLHLWVPLASKAPH